MRTTFNNLTLVYQTAGRGRPLLFIHGYPLSRKLWAGQLRGLAPHAQALAPDLPGFGDSAPQPGPCTVERLADDCVAFLEALGIAQPAVVCGLSMGGYVALAFYRKYAARTAGLILAATRPGADTAEGKAARDKTAALAQEHGAEAIAKAMLPKMFAPATYTAHPELVERGRQIMLSASTPGIVGALQAMRDRPDATPLLAKIKVPTLIVHGAQDQIMPLSEPETMHRLIANSHLVILPKSGHLPNLEQPRAFNQAIRNFLGTL
jgi:pimeloyl-ACP methyl ester carboxylesterase